MVISSLSEIPLMSSYLQPTYQNPMDFAFPYPQDFSFQNYPQYNTNQQISLNQFIYQQPFMTLPTTDQNTMATPVKDNISNIRAEILKNFSSNEFQITMKTCQQNVTTILNTPYDTPPRLSHCVNNDLISPIINSQNKRKISFAEDEDVFKLMKNDDEQKEESQTNSEMLTKKSPSKKCRRRRRKKSVNAQMIKNRRDVANEREKLRIKKMKSAFSVLQNRLPSHLVQQNMKKVDILTSAMDYILDLKAQL